MKLTTLPDMLDSWAALSFQGKLSGKKTSKTTHSSSRQEATQYLISVNIVFFPALTC